MSNEPVWVMHAYNLISIEERHKWTSEMSKQAKANGGVFARVSVDPDERPNEILFEVWKERPDDQGEPRWHLFEKQSR